jgi:hypothetical protein
MTTGEIALPIHTESWCNPNLRNVLWRIIAQQLSSIRKPQPQLREQLMMHKGADKKDREFEEVKVECVCPACHKKHYPNARINYNPTQEGQL